MKKQNLYAIIAAFIWGTAFVAQSVGADTVTPFAFNMSRSLIATIFLCLVVFLISLYKKKKSETIEKTNNKKLFIGGILCGTALSVATALQQASLSDTAAGKAGFITALYIVIVPILSIFLKKRAPFTVWVSVIIAVIGLYFLCVKGDFSVGKSDVLLILCAFVFSIQILLIDYFAAFVDGIKLSCVQFATSTVLSFLGMAVFETFDFNAIINCAVPILYLGVFSSGIAYTLQILAQKDSNPTVITLLLSLESVFSVISGAILLGDKLSFKEYIGCFLMFLAVILAQLPTDVFSIKRKKY
ncbi:MAG: DMT family transporter [Acutalibacteraceae bacterium]|nr:DMT family transporter [Acutalibacteraceae bacterium]